MKRLGKKVASTLETVEAYACICGCDCMSCSCGLYQSYTSRYYSTNSSKNSSRFSSMSY